MTNPAALLAGLQGDHMNAQVASTPGGIERQEANGQKWLVASNAMPIDMKPSREAFEALGFLFGQTVTQDDIFIAATFPRGWTRRATEHALYSMVVDERGRDRVEVFYKAAFYDRKARSRLIGCEA